MKQILLDCISGFTDEVPEIYISTTEKRYLIYFEKAPISEETFRKIKDSLSVLTNIQQFHYMETVGLCFFVVTPL